MKRTLLDPMYHQRVDLCSTREACIKTLNNRWRKSGHDLVGIDYLKDTDGLTVEIDEALVLGVFDGKLATLAHECVHLATRTLRIHGIPITHQNDEAIAYLVGWFFQAWQRRMV